MANRCEDKGHALEEGQPQIVYYAVDGTKRCATCQKRELARRLASANPLIPSDTNYVAR